MLSDIILDVYKLNYNLIESLQLTISIVSVVILSVAAPSQVVEFNLSCLASLLGRDS
jgi:hypothetical protein